MAQAGNRNLVLSRSATMLEQLMAAGASAFLPVQELVEVLQGESFGMTAHEIGFLKALMVARLGASRMHRQSSRRGAANVRNGE
jgi:hypothetical protein